jgi:hypothetical protein
MKDAILAILAALLIVTNLENLFLDQEYKRVVWMSSAKKGRAYWKGYLSALQFAIDVLSKE